MQTTEMQTKIQNGRIFWLQTAARTAESEGRWRLILEQEGYEVLGGRVTADLSMLFGNFTPDAVVAPLPDATLCREFRRQYPRTALLCVDVPSATERTALLEAGADDCLSDKADGRELIARIRAVIRRYCPSAEEDGDRIRYENFSLSRKNYELRLNGEQVALPPKELELLYCLAAHPNHVFTREELLDQVWGFEYLGDTRTIDVHIKRLRSKCEGLSTKWGIRTVWGVGYKFEAAV
jgi:DNA-binding response OmpR family regulator